ncbi:MerR family transcriptional regulator [Streptomyces sp. P38-E01]|uniref:MerR family transcriptional regulator n=1 Tax=Streptomyces tardus TaxID=2780544 RepID=A0A949JIL3_9ACTN|nr:MerR family transcriptional regulator [Streptomyces tardus]MBU7600132.1 MerR family transcriptional regulator [Streptomyces tardus]
MLHTPSGGAGRGTAASGRAPMSIGAVLSLLREEFPEVTLSKIRFLESEGLVEPQRTPSGYRKFTAGDVDRLARVLRMQRDNYLPLKVIREQLDAQQRGAAPVPSQPCEPPQEPVSGPASGEGESAVHSTRAELLAAVGASTAELAEWESHGLVRPEGDDSYTPESVEVARLVASLCRHGFEPRHLRGVRAAAEREAAMVEQLVAPLRKHRNPRTRTHAEETATELAALSTRLHAAFLHTEVRDRLC